MWVSSEMVSIMLQGNRCAEDINSLRKKAAVCVQYFWDIRKQQIGTIFTAQICRNINQSSHLSFPRIKYVSHIYRKTDSLVVMLIQLLKNLLVSHAKGLLCQATHYWLWLTASAQWKAEQGRYVAVFPHNTASSNVWIRNILSLALCLCA